MSDPLWYQKEAPLGSAVRFLSSLSPRFNWVGVYLLKGKSLVLGPYIGASTPHRRIPVGRGVCGQAVATGQDQNVADVSQAANYLACNLLTKSELVVLIRNKRGKIVGQIDIDSYELNAFGSDEVQQVKEVAMRLGEQWRG